ncbi:MAG: hypothetical protein HN742_32475 [Lentisphaerae bacterium]|jgi:hypothetical protein|nr:hypothetical protein [Lentisphaerota bacterium]MBT4814160.1 hypothetical protein [Lentisphaerota bacterium]MBT5609836.1 hypothetical protein [Lentisphaerota bacterium]MBT7054387.1 hypothetical protein [Lentisphaerota bacterium]MBT7846631.1 hypothetical protein [Lentisphaerota bacterium]
MNTRQNIASCALILAPGLLCLSPLLAAPPTSLRNPKAVVFHDFLELQPPGAVQTSSRMDTWYLRTEAEFMATADNVLHLGDGGEWPDLIYTPGVKGRYNLYIGMRATGQGCHLQIKTDTMTQYASVRLKPHDPVHVNYDILWATNVPMDGRTIEIHPVSGSIYLDYLSLVPVAHDRENLTLSEFVTLEPKRENTDLASYLAEHDERTYRDPSPMPALHPDSRERGFVLFSRPWMDLVFPNAIPADDPGSVELACRAARGEYEPMVLALRALRDLESLSIVLEKSPVNGQAPLPPEAIDIRRVRCLRKRTTQYSRRSEYMDMPTYAETIAPHSVGKDATQAYWITAHIPDHTPAGTYTGQLAVREGDRTVAAVPLRITVYPFTLAPLKDTNFGMYYAPRSAPSSAEDRQLVLDAFRDMHNHGLNSVAWFLPLDAPITGDFPTIELDFDSASIAIAMDAFHQSGMNGDFLWCYQTFMPQIGHLLPDEEAYEQAHVAITSAILAEARKRKWPRVIFQPYDEVPSHPGTFPALLRELRCLKKAGATTEHDHLWLKTNRADIVQKGIDQCAPLIDVFTLRYSAKPIFYVDSWQEITRKAQAMGKTLYTYNINNGLAISELESMRFSSGWFFRSVGTGCRGYYLWTWQRGTGSFYNDFDGSTDWIQNYPESPRRWKAAGGPALYWEALREGIDDLKYIQHLERLLQATQTDPGRRAAAQEAAKTLAGLASSIDIEALQNRCVFLECQWERSGKDEDGTRWAEGRFQLPNGWTFETYDDARRTVADMITQLSQ